MSERYSKLFALPENLYATGSPVVIAAGALLKDNQTGKILAQLKLRNIGKKTIKAATVCVEPLDTVGKPLGEPVTYQYLDLHADRDADFGQKAPVALPDSATRSFAVSVVQVIFTDNSIWNADGTDWESLNRPVPLDLLEDDELAKQFRIEYGGGCENLLLEQKDLWHCVCGGVNHQEEANCHKCGMALAELQAIDRDNLRKAKDERVAKERAEAEVSRKEAEIAAAKTKKIGMISAIAAAILVVIVVAANAIIGMVKENNAYKDALALMDGGQYEEAISAFEAMDGYKDSAAQIEACYGAITDRDYNTAVQLMNAGQYEEAIAVFQTTEGYKDSAAQSEKCHYSAAEEALANGDATHAAMHFGAADYSDSKARSMELWNEIAVRETISAGWAHTVGLKSDGTVVAVGDNEDGQCNVSGWTDIVAISAGRDHTVGLKSDGTVVAVGGNEYGQCDVSDWTDIVAISAGFLSTFGLKADGTMVVAPNIVFDEWSDIVVISGSGSYLKSDGTLAISKRYPHIQENIYWTDIAAFSYEYAHAVGLKSDGTVVAVGDNDHGQCDISGWTDIVAIATGEYHTVGLKSDGTVVAKGSKSYRDDACDVSDWTDIVAISAGYEITVGLKSDGTVVAIGYNHDGQCNVSGWTDIKQP